MMFKKVFLIASTLLLLPTAAFAHSFKGDAGFMSGLFHPVLGFDHLLAMLSVGIVSAQMGGRAIWTVPLAFVTFMGVGGFLGMQGIPVPGVEYGIAISVLRFWLSGWVDLHAVTRSAEIINQTAIQRGGEQL